VNARVALVHGDNRYDNIARALDLVSAQVDLQGRRQVVIKPNFVSTRRQLAATHVDAVRAVLDFVRARYAGRLVIAEGAALSSTWEGFERFGYLDLANRYAVALMDLNADQVVPVQVYDRRLKPITLRLARTVVESDFRISVGPPKTHDAVIVTLSLKNMIMGSLVNPAVASREDAQRPATLGRLARVTPRFVRESPVAEWAKARLPVGNSSDKLAMHQGYSMINLNLAMLAPWVQPHLAVIDGFQAMEGAGPVDGDPVDWQIALAGTDALAVDSLTTHLMGFDPAEVGYLDYCRRLELGIGEMDRIAVIGDVDPDSVRRRFRPHPTYRQQRDWHLPGVECLPLTPTLSQRERESRLLAWGKMQDESQSAACQSSS
jgi:uncharacterized protein (DUF362 family)